MTNIVITIKSGESIVKGIKSGKQRYQMNYFPGNNIKESHWVGSDSILDLLEIIQDYAEEQLGGE